MEGEATNRASRTPCEFAVAPQGLLASHSALATASGATAYYVENMHVNPPAPDAAQLIDLSQWCDDIEKFTQQLCARREVIAFSTEGNPLYLNPAELAFDLHLVDDSKETSQPSRAELDIPLEQLFAAVEKSRRTYAAPSQVQVIGDAGSGKSTLGETIVSRVNGRSLWVEQFPQGAVLVRVRDLDEAKHPVPRDADERAWVTFLVLSKLSLHIFMNHA